MIRDRALKARDKLVGKLPVSGELLRGSLLERTVRHAKGCPKCARGEGHQVFVLTVTYAGGRTQQFSVRRERVAEVRRWLNNYQKLKQGIEDICELNHELLRPEPHTGETPFCKGEQANEMFLIVTGKFLVKELDIELAAGCIVGELGFLSPNNRRTQTVECIEGRKC
jgi:CRP-like cAMP-binding protein